MKRSASITEKAKDISAGLNQIQVEMYGFGRELRRYCYLPPKFPLRIKSQHGIVLWNSPSLHELNSPLPFMLVFSQRHRAAWRKLSKKPCFIIKSPFYLYRKRENVQMCESRSGSLFFLSHSTFSKETDINFIQLIEQLKTLREDFKPVTVCLHFVDVLKNRHQLFQNAGLNCVTAGHMFNRDFISNFYGLLINYKYCLSNDIGSHAFYAIDLGIPFSLLGDPAQIKVTEQEAMENSLLKKNLDFQVGVEKVIGRNQLNYSISPELKDMVDDELGIEKGLGRFKLGLVLIASSILYFISKMVERLVQ